MIFHDQMTVGEGHRLGLDPSCKAELFFLVSISVESPVSSLPVVMKT